MIDAKLDVELFIDGYITAALWSSTDNSTDSGGDPLDDNFDRDDLSPEAYQSMREDCLDFIENNYADLVEYVERYQDMDYAGHDFWLTRCGHGAGFWDRGLGQLGNRLSEACRPYGDCYIYLGDDGRLHI